jgi:uncharacterized protein YutE (UPF0331/DUF86 family)
VADVVIETKAGIIERCIAQVYLYYRGHEDGFRADQMRQDAVVINITRACEAAIDMAHRVALLRRLGPAMSSADRFRDLARARLIDRGLSERLVAMTGFRNVATHEYQKLKIEVVEAIAQGGIEDLRRFSRLMIEAHPAILPGNPGT